MRVLLSLALLLAGLATTGAAYLRSEGPVRPASPWSLSERLAALRINRALPAGIRKQATVSLRGEHAVLKVRDGAGPVLLKCPAGTDVAEALAGYATSATPPGCETQAAGEAGDVLVYEVSGRVAPLCPGQYATLTEQQLHNALYLPAVSLGPDAPPAVLQPGRLTACARGEANCALSKAASALIYCGEVRTCAEGACFQGKPAEIRPDDVAASLYYYQALAQAQAPSAIAPASCGAVPMSIHLSTLISEAITATSAPAFIEAQPWSAATLTGAGNAETAADLRAFFARHPRGLCLYIRGVDVDRPRDAEMAAQSLAFPVFAPFDPRAADRATPLYRALQHAALDEDAMRGVLARCDLSDEHACALKRGRIAAQLRAAVGSLHPALSNLAADELPYHVGASGPFHLGDYDSLHLSLESAAEVPRSGGAPARLSVSYQPLWPESVTEKRVQCQQQPGVCVFRALWGPRGPAAAATPEQGESTDGFESLVALFARRDANTRCVRRLFDALGAAPDDRLLELQRELREPVGAGENRAPCDPRARAVNGLTPRAGEGGGCPEKKGEEKKGDTIFNTARSNEVSPGDCRPVSLVYVQEEPWAGAASRIASMAAASHVAVAVTGIKASEVHRGSLGSWDVLLTVASNYYNRKYPTLVPLLHPAGNQNLSGGQAISEGSGRQLLTAYESSIVFPPPTWLGAPSVEPRPRAESLRLLEEDVARAGPAPIFPLAFLRPATLTIPASFAEAAQSPWYFAQLIKSWSPQR